MGGTPYHSIEKGGCEAEPAPVEVVGTGMRRVVLVSLALVTGCTGAPPPVAATVTTTQAASSASDDELAHAAEVFEAAGVMGKAIAARRLLIERAGKDPARAAASVYRLGIDLRDAAEYEPAASALERFALENPLDPQAPGALTDALLLRLALNDEPHARADVDRFLKAYATTKPQQAAILDYAIAAHEGELGDWAAAERALTATMAAIDRGPVYLRMCAHALLGKAFASHAGDARAAAEYARVRELGASLAEDASDPAGMKMYAKGLNALGEAILFDADAHRAAATWTHLAPYAGSGDDAALDRWIATTVAPWIALRRTTIASLEREYQKAITVSQYPSPRAVVDAASRVAMMWAGAADELLQLPSPARWAPKVRKSYRDKLEKAAAPLLDDAKPAVRTCVAYSVKYQWFDEASAACGAWLAKTQPAEALDELLVVRPFRSTGPSSAHEDLAPLRAAKPDPVP